MILLQALRQCSSKRQPYVGLLSPSGSLIQKLSYDAWGNLRNPKSYSQPFGGTPLLRRGFTGHEHLDKFGLINMNGRMYDPRLGRFLSPDNFVQAPDFTQNFNRYSYCLNNPLVFTDPDGELFIEAMIIGAFINTFIQGASGNINSAGDFFLSIGIGALSGAAGYGAGQLVAGVVGTIGFAGGAITGVAGGFAGGFVGGAGNAWARGANFGDGLVSGLQAGAIGGLTGGFIGGIAGGINAVKHSGNFWSGDGIIYESISPAGAQGNGFKFKNDEEMLAWLEENNVNLDDFGVDKLTAYEDVNFTRGKYDYFRGDDGIIYKMNNKTFATIKVGGFTQLNGGPFSRTSDIFISRYADFGKFTGVLNHELIHAYHISQGLHLAYGRSFRAYTERIAYEYGAGIGLNSISEAYKWIPPPYAPIMPPYLVPFP